MSNGRHVIFIGAGHAHLTALKHLDSFMSNGHRVTVINSGDYHYYSGMGPGLLSGIYRPNEVRFNVKKLTEDRGGTFIRDRASVIQPCSREVHTENGNVLRYDLLSVNTGSIVESLSVSKPDPAVITVKPVENLHRAGAAISEALKTRPLTLSVIGGGAAGVEIAAGLRRLTTDTGGKARITLYSSGHILKRFSPRARHLVLNKFHLLGIKVVEDSAVHASGEEGVIKFSNGSAVRSDFTLIASGIRPSPLAKNSGLAVSGDGGMRVNRFLQSISDPRVFGGGDCIHFDPQPLAKIGVHAVRENHVLLHNILARAEGRPLRPFRPQKNFLLLLNMGDDTGILIRGRLVLECALAFRLKDFIDRRFMRKFQLSGERCDTVDEIKME